MADKASKTPRRGKPVAGVPVAAVTVVQRAKPVLSEVSKLVAKQNRGATSTGYPETKEKVATESGRGLNSKSF